MPEPQTPAEPQAGGAGNEPQPQAGNTPQTEPQAGDSQEPMSLDEAKKLRSEANNLRKRLKAFEDAQAAADQAKLTETERLQKTATDLQSKYDSDMTALVERIVGYEVQLSAAKLGIIDPDAAAHLINWDALEYNEDGMPTNVESVLKDLLKAKPYLAGRQAGSISGGATNPSRTTTGNVGQITRDNLEQAMKDYNSLSPSEKAEVTRLLTNRI